MRKVALEAGVTLSNVQYYYNTKIDLISGLMAGYLEEYKDSFLQSIDKAHGGKEALREFIAYLIMEEADADEIKLSVALTSFAEQPNFSNTLNRFFDELYDLLVQFLSLAADKPRDAKNLHQAAAILLPFINGYGLVSQSLQVNQEATTELLTEIIWRVVINS